MFFALKILKVVIKVILVGVLLLVGYLVYEFKVSKVSSVELGRLSVVEVGQSYMITIKDNQEGIIKGMVDKANDFLYKSAENSNPTKYLFPENSENKEKKN